MVLLSFLLVLAAAVTLVIGLVGTGLGLIYVSIVCSLAAGLVLAVAVVRSRPSTELAAAGPAPLPGNEPLRYASGPSRSSIPGGTSVADREDDERPTDTLDVGERIRVFADPVADGQPDPGDVVASEPALEPVAAATTWDVRDDDWGGAADDVFPIAEYDSLRVTQIVPLLSQLDADELEVVREREVSVKGGRASVLNRIDALLGRTAPAPAPAKKAPVAKKTPAAKKAPVAKKAAAAQKPAPAPATKAVAKKAAPTAAKKAAATKTAATKAAPAAAKKAAKSTKATKAAKKQP